MHFPHRTRRNERSNQLPADREGHLRYQSADADVHDAAHQLVASADALVRHPALAFIAASRAIEQAIDFRLRYAVVPAGRFYRFQLAVVDPLLDCGIADLQLHSSVPGSQQSLTRGILIFFCLHALLLLQTSERKANRKRFRVVKLVEMRDRDLFACSNAEPQTSP